MTHSSGRRASRWGTVEIRDDLVRRYVEDRPSLRQIAAELGCGYGTVHLVLSTARVPLRPRGGPRRRTALTPGEPTSARRFVPTVAAAPDLISSRHPWSRS